MQTKCLQKRNVKDEKKLLSRLAVCKLSYKVNYGDSSVLFGARARVSELEEASRIFLVVSSGFFASTRKRRRSCISKRPSLSLSLHHLVAPFL